MRKVACEDYAFAVGKIRALERFLFTTEVFQQAMNAQLGAALQLFAESKLYSDDLMHVKDSRELELLLGRELEGLKTMISQLILDTQLRALIDLSSLAQAQAVARQYQSSFLETYLNMVIDMHNIKTFLRLYCLKEPQDKLVGQLNCEGFISGKDFIALYNQDIAFFIARLKYVQTPGPILDYGALLQEGIEKAVKEGLFIVLERQISDLLIDALKPAKYFTFGPEPVLAYYFARLNEISLVRMIILSKLNNVSEDLIQERLNSAYA